MSVFQKKTPLTESTVVIPPNSLKLPDAGSVQTFMFNAVQGQLTEECVVKVNTALASQEPKKVTEKRSKNLENNILIQAQLYRVAAKRLCQLRCLKPAEVDKLKAAVVTSGTLTDEQKQFFDDRYNMGRVGIPNFNDGNVTPQAWYLMEKVEDLVEFDTYRISQAKERRGEKDFDAWLVKWKASAQKALRRKGTWADLGCIATVDMFVGNKDRLDPFVSQDVPKDSKNKDMVVINAGNVMIGKDGPVGLDYFDCLAGGSSWDLYHEYKELDANWPGYFLSETIPTSVKEARRVRTKTVAERKEEFAVRVVKELMRRCELTDDHVKASIDFIDGMQFAAGTIQYWVRKTSKQFCKEIGAPVPPGLAQRDQLIWGN